MPNIPKEKGMIKMKKRFSILVALAMLLTTLVPSFTANAAFSDVDSTHPYKEAITTLSLLDVINGYEDGTFAPDKEISRAEFTKMIVYMLGMGEFTTPITTFDDVPTSHWANPNIKTAFDRGIINGFDDGTFRPDEPVTYEQALKMVVCTLGYQPYAESLGGYPNGYINQASTLKLTEDILSPGYSQNATRGMIAQIMFNALEVEMYEVISEELRPSGKTLLNDYLNVASVEGVLVGVEQSTTSECSSPLATGKLAVKDSTTAEEYIIDFSKHGIKASELINILGNTVKVFYSKDRLSNDRWLVDISNEIHTNTEITINSSEIIEFTGNSIRYRLLGESNTKTINLDTANLSIRYNGKAVTDTDTVYGNTFPSALNDLLNPSSPNFIYGTVKAISNDSANDFNILDIYNYETIVAQSALKSSDYKITDKLVPATTLVINPSAKDYKFTLTRNSKEVEPTNIIANDVINYAISLDGKYKTVKATSSSVSGKISSLNTSKQTLVIDGKIYSYSDYFENYLLTKEQKALEPGLEIKAYIDSMNTIQWGTITTTEGYYPYAYVVDAYRAGGEYCLDLFAPSNRGITSLSASTSYTVKSYDISEDVKLNGSKSNPSAILVALEETADTAYPSGYPDSSEAGFNVNDYNQFIKVGFDASGKINHVITISSTEGTENKNSSALVRYSKADTALQATSSAMKNGSTTLYSIKSSTPLFVIPADRTNKDGYALKNAISSSSMQTNTADRYKVEAYDLNSSKYPTCMLIYASSIQSGTPITADTKFSLIAGNIYEEMDSDGDVVQKFDTYSQATSQSAVTIADSPLNDFTAINKGDIVLFAYDSENKANDYNIPIKYSDVTAQITSKTYDWTDSSKFYSRTNSSSKYITASMYNVLQALYDENTLYVTKKGFDASGVSLAESYDTIKITDNTAILRYDAEEEEFTPYAVDSTENLTINDILDIEHSGMNCSKIMVGSYHTSSTAVPIIRFIVIYE